MSGLQAFLDSCLAQEGVLKKPLACVEEQEQTFLDLGMRLQSIHQAAAELSEQGMSLVEATSLDQLADMTSTLTKELASLQHVCHEKSEHSQVEDLLIIGDSLKNLNRLADNFRRIVRSLSMLGISTRIESARLGSAGHGFMSLADDVEGLAGKIVDYSSRIIDSSSGLELMVQQALEQSRHIQAIQQECSTKTFEELSDSIARLDGVGQASGRASEDLAALARELTEHIGSMVASMQFHDIVRQQVEHVRESADDIMALIREQSGRAMGDDERSELVAWVREACRLQGRQLDNASIRFSDAVEALRQEFGAVQANIHGAREAVKRVAGSDSKEDDNALLHVRRGVTSIGQSMGTFRDKGREVAGVMSQVSDMVSELVGLVDNIQDVGHQIELIALNASIKAAHTGEKGKALGVLAASIQTLSLEAREHTDRTAEALNVISRAAEVLQSASDDDQQQERMDTASQNLSMVIDSAEELGKEVEGSISLMDGQCDTLEHLIVETVSDLAVDREVREVLGQGARNFNDLADAAAALSSVGSSELHDQRLNAMLERYTMEAERLVHLGEKKDEAAAGPITDQAQEEWDNIELF